MGDMDARTARVAFLIKRAIEAERYCTIYDGSEWTIEVDGHIDLLHLATAVIAGLSASPELEGVRVSR